MPSSRTTKSRWTTARAVARLGSGGSVGGHAARPGRSRRPSPTPRRRRPRGMSATSRPSCMTSTRSAMPEHLRQLAGDHQHRHAVGGQLGEQPVHLGLGAHVDAPGRLVDDQHPRLRWTATWPARPSAGCRRTAWTPGRSSRPALTCSRSRPGGGATGARRRRAAARAGPATSAGAAWRCARPTAPSPGPAGAGPPAPARGPAAIAAAVSPGGSRLPSTRTSPRVVRGRRRRPRGPPRCGRRRPGRPARRSRRRGRRS